MNQRIKLTTAQFARLHNVNRRTLHYYDHIGLFSPRYKGENGYRYYDYSQSIDFAYIRMLKEIDLRIEEIKKVIHAFNEEEFLDTMTCKQKEIDMKIERLKNIKTILAQKQEHLLLCRRINDMDIKVTDLKAEYLLTVPYDFEEDNATQVFQYIQSVWSPEQYRAGVGSYISLGKIQAGQFDSYDGLYALTTQDQGQDNPQDGLLLKPQGTYLCGYLKGAWNRLPELYGKMLEYARLHRLHLTGYAFEYGINDFMIASDEEYITQIAIRIQ